MTPAELEGKRQAVILIHGVGEQRPMETLRAFMDGFVDASGEDQYFSKPDSFSESFELRRFTSKTDSPRTDFFEFYWQHKMKDSKLSHVLSWLWTLLRRPPKTVPHHLLGLWLFTWAVTLMVVALLTWSAILWFSTPATTAEARHPAGTPLAVSLLLALVQGFVLAYVGDAARYLSAAPSNIDCRHAIRVAGVRLLIHLHASGKYSRIAVVGHSLGSVIGYDILTYTWQQFHNLTEPRRRWDRGRPISNQAETEAVDVERDQAERVADHEGPIAPARSSTIDAIDLDTFLAEQHPTLTKMQTLINGLGVRNDETAMSADQREAFRALQRELWLEYRELRMPWIVTDFVTVGSPLAHAVLLMANDRPDLHKKQAQRELPRCPPVSDPKAGISFVSWEGFRPKKTLHHAACFAVTRWSNVYFPTRLFLFGDFVAGPVAGLFGPGISDVTVRTREWYGWFSHTSYWKPRDRNDEKGSIKALRNALDLDCTTFDHLPAPPNLDRVETSTIPADQEIVTIY